MHNLKFKITLVLITLLLASCGSTPGAPTDEPPDFATLLAIAEEAYRFGDFDLAYETSQEILQADPANAAAWELNRQAAIAQAGDDYLHWLPDDRYRVSPETFLYEQVNGRQFFIFDVREPDEYNAGHIDGAVNIPLRELLDNINQLPDKSVPILVYCRSQKRSTHALVVLRELGFVQAFNLEGGFNAYQEYIATNPDIVPDVMPTLPPISTEGCQNRHLDLPKDKKVFM